MLEDEEDDYSESVFAVLDNHSREISEELEFQLFSSRHDFHHEEICGWCVSPCDVQRFKWNLQRKVIKTPNKEQKTNLNRRSCGSRQNNHKQLDILYDFKHYRHVKSYIEQYRNDKTTQQYGGLTELLSNSLQELRKDDICEHCMGKCTGQSCESAEIHKSAAKTATRPQSIPNTAVNGVMQDQKTTAPKWSFRGGLYGIKDAKWKEHMDNITAPNMYSRGLGNKLPVGNPSLDESWTVVGVEKRPLPPQKKRYDSYSTLPSQSNSRAHQKQHVAISKCETWVRNREQVLASSCNATADNHKATPRSYSAPNIGTAVSRQHLWRQSQLDSKKPATMDPIHLQGKGLNSSVDYSCYTEMFKNVLEYYGTKKLKPKPRLAPSAEAARLLSIKT